LKLFVNISDKRYEVEIPTDENIGRISVDGHKLNVDYNKISGDKTVSLIIDGRIFTAEYNPLEDICQVQIEGYNYNALVTDERRDAINRLIGTKKVSNEALQKIKAPMPGLIVKLNVSEGDTVKQGQGVIVIEAMKMENDIPSPIDGVVSELYVDDGKIVEKGELLLIIKRNQ